jgi:tetratricopeptide (TPR) repeat protein
VLAAVAVFCGQRFIASFSRQMDRAAERYDKLPVTRTETSLALGPDTATADTNGPAGAGLTSTQEVATTTEAADTNAPAAPAEAVTPAPRATTRSDDDGGLKGVDGALALAALLALGFLVGRDVSGYLTHRVHREIYGEASEPEGDPEYDEAERVWASGDPLEAVRLLRDFLMKKPGKLHAAFRIAEIYEKDLRNPLASALEYETILQHRFEPERWGWAAIHLVNLYNRLGQEAKAEALLRRILDEYPQTEAAAKARERLGEPPPAPGEEAPPPEDGQFHLPRGFKPKKG